MGNSYKITKFLFIFQKSKLQEINQKFTSEEELRKTLNQLSFEKGFKLCKIYGKKDSTFFIVFCNYGGRQRQSVSEGKRKTISKKISIINYYT